MKLNFWQIIGVVLLIVGLSWVIYEQVKPKAPAPPAAPATAPTTATTRR